jgi:hypothetical protein
MLDREGRFRDDWDLYRAEKRAKLQDQAGLLEDNCRRVRSYKQKHTSNSYAMRDGIIPASCCESQAGWIFATTRTGWMDGRMDTVVLRQQARDEVQG